MAARRLHLRIRRPCLDGRRRSEDTSERAGYKGRGPYWELTPNDNLTRLAAAVHLTGAFSELVEQYAPSPLAAKSRSPPVLNFIDASCCYHFHKVVTDGGRSFGKRAMVKGEQRQLKPVRNARLVVDAAQVVLNNLFGCAQAYANLAVL
jgi:hypothetical protein